MNQFHKLRHQFKRRHTQAVQSITDVHPVARKVLDQAKQTSNKTQALIGSSVAAGMLAGAMLLSPVKALAELPGVQELPVNPPTTGLNTSGQILPTTWEARPGLSLVTLLSRVLPSKPRVLTAAESQGTERVIRRLLNIPVATELDGNRLNTAYGFMGAEQHLPRFPSDTIDQHDAVQASGITSSTGAWGYFASSKSALTDEDIQKEKYYFAVQTFISPGWEERLYKLREWFKHRKMVAINPKTGAAVVGVVADAGPAVWTGKQFGGSPEVMEGLGLHRGMRKGEVLLLFVDDPNDEIPLGPVEISSKLKVQN